MGRRHLGAAISALALAAAAGCDEPEPKPPEPAVAESLVPGSWFPSPTTAQLIRAEPRIAEEVAALTADDGGDMAYRLDSVVPLLRRTPAELFPGWRFYRLEYSVARAPAGWHIPGGLGLTLAIDEQGSGLRVSREPDFLVLLAWQGITVASDADARRVLLAFRELSCDQRESCEALERVSENEWLVDVRRYEHVLGQTESSREVLHSAEYFRLVTDQRTHRVVAWEKVLERGEPRLEPVDDPEGDAR